jgi:hypothetical protein
MVAIRRVSAADTKRDLKTIFSVGPFPYVSGNQQFAQRHPDGWPARFRGENGFAAAGIPGGVYGGRPALVCAGQPYQCHQEARQSRALEEISAGMGMQETREHILFFYNYLCSSK